ncbi:MAG: hypothetical protein ACUVUG_04275 [Candidatus Aminicenantia bacterium]
MYKGLLINSIIGFGVFLVSFFTAYFLLSRRRKGTEQITFGYSFFWLCVGLVYFFVGLRNLFAYLSNPSMDKIFFFVDNAFGGLMAPFIIFIFLFFLTEKAEISFTGGIIFMLIWIIWVFVNLKGGVSGPHISYWQSEWEPSKPARIINAFGLFIPGFLSAIGIGIFSFKLKTKISRFRALTTSASIVLIAIIVLLDYWGAVGIPGRILILLASFLALIGYNPPLFIRRKLE